MDMSDTLVLRAAESLVAAGRFDEAHDALGLIEVPLIPDHEHVLRVIECQAAITEAQSAA
jgi:hypothetical protein